MAEYDVDKVLVIDNELRTIDIPEDLLLGVESDESVQKLIFDMPRYYNGIDLSAFVIRVNYMNANNEGDVYLVSSPTIDTERITFTWVVGRQATKYKGDTHFVVCLKKLRSDQTIEQEFNTTVHALPVLVGLETTQAIIEEHPDVFEQLLVNLNVQTAQAVQQITTTGQQYVNQAAASAQSAATDKGLASVFAMAARADADRAEAAAESVDADEWNKKIQKAFVGGVSSGEIASFDDGADDIPVKSLTAQIEPVQNLNGYDHPWPGGGNINKANPDDATLSGFTYSNGVYTNSLTDTKTELALDFDALNGSTLVQRQGVNISATGTYTLTITVDSEITTLRLLHNGGQRNLSITWPFTEQGSYTLSVKVNGYNPSTVGGLSITDVMISTTGGPFVPYSNICPIYSQAEKNVLPMSLAWIKANNTSGTWSGNAYTINNITYTVSADADGNITGIKVDSSAAASAAAIIYLATNYPLAAGDYTLNGGVASGLYVRAVVDGVSYTAADSEISFNVTNASVIGDVFIRTNSGIAPSNAWVYPMIRNAVNPDPTFVPYRCVARVDVEGKNLFDVNSYPLTTGKRINGSNGTSADSADVACTLSYIPIRELAGQTITLNHRPSGANNGFAFYDENQVFVSGEINAGATAGTPWTITVPEDAHYMRFTCASAKISEIQLELGSTATEYEAFKDSTYFSLAKNVWDEEWEVGGYNDDGSKSTTTSEIRGKNAIAVLPNTSYYFKTPVWGVIYQFDADGSLISRTPLVGGTYGAVITTASNCRYLRFYLNSAYGTTYNGDIAILNAPPEIWGGELNTTTGELKVTFTKITIDGTLNWTLATGSAAGTGIAYREYDNLIKSTNYREKIFATNLKTAGNNSVTQLTEYCISGYVDYSSQWAGKNWLYVNVGTGKTAEEIKAWFGENPTDVVYELATPQIFQLDPVEVKTWLANNNITANTGEIIELIYAADPKLYIDGKVPDAPSEDGTYTLKAIVSDGSVVYNWVVQ